jgi:hypothetical protein
VGRLLVKLKNEKGLTTAAVAGAGAVAGGATSYEPSAASPDFLSGKRPIQSPKKYTYKLSFHFISFSSALFASY